MTNSYLPAQIQEVGQFADIAVASGLFGRGENLGAELVVKLMAGASWGVPPMAALTDVYVVKGKPQMSGTLLRALIRKHPGYDYKILRQDDEAAAMEFFSVAPDGSRRSEGVIEFTMAMAQRAGYTSNPNYRKAPRNMLLARCTSDGCKAYCPDVFMGSVYSEGELDDHEYRGAVPHPQPAPGEAAPANPKLNGAVIEPAPAEVSPGPSSTDQVEDVVDVDFAVSQAEPRAESVSLEVDGVLVRAAGAPDGFPAERWEVGLRKAFEGCSSWSDEQRTSQMVSAMRLKTTGDLQALVVRGKGYAK